jgi:predicted dinucleotide-binding enzyme
VIDCGNPYVERDGSMAADALAKGTGITSAEYLPGVKLVRAFNAIGWQQVRDQTRRDGEKIAIPIAADDPAAINVAEQLVQDAGFDPVVVGGLNTAKQFDHGSAVYVKSLTARELREALQLPQK